MFAEHFNMRLWEEIFGFLIRQGSHTQPVAVASCTNKYVPCEISLQSWGLKKNEFSFQQTIFCIYDRDCNSTGFWAKKT